MPIIRQQVADREKIAAHHQDTDLFRIAHDRPITLHPDDPIDNGKVRFQCGCTVESRIPDSGMVQNVFRPTIVNAF